MVIKAFLPIGYIGFYLFAIGALIALATYTWQFRSIPGARQQVYNQICKGIWLLSMVLVSVSSELADKIFWYQIYYMAMACSPFLWLLFILKISNQETSLLRKVKYGFGFLVVCLCLLILSNGSHGLFWSQYWLEDRNFMMVEEFGLLAVGISSYSLSAISVYLSVRWFVGSVGLRRRQALWFALTPFLSLMGVIKEGDILGIEGLAPLPLGFLLTALFMAWGFYRWQVYNVLPLAQQAAAKNMFDGLVVVDEYGYIADMNAAAEAILDGLSARVGGCFSELARAWPVLGEAFDHNGQAMLEAVQTLPTGTCYYQLSVTSLQNNGHWLGKVILIKDITQQKQDQAKVLEQQKAISILTERERLRRELHDGPGQVWGYLKLQYQIIQDMIAEKNWTEAGARVTKLLTMADELHTDVRGTLHELTPSKGKNLADNLRELFSWYQENYGIPVQFIGSSLFAANFSPTDQLQLLRIIQEALTNIRKHGGASQVKVEFQNDQDQPLIVIEDNGCGFNLEQVRKESGDHHGMAIMRERAAEIGAGLNIVSRPGGGTCVSIFLPQVQEVTDCETSSGR